VTVRFVDIGEIDEPLEIQVLAWDRHNNMAELNRLMGSQPSSLDN
jgi:hypothetical protein